VRLAVLLTFMLIIGGVRWQRRHKDVEVMIVRDISPSTLNVTQFPGSKGLQSALNDFFRAIAEARDKKPDDRVGVLSFNDTSLIDAMPNRQLMLDAKATREPGNGTDAASAIQLALATL